MTSTRITKLAREIQRQTGVPYSLALREAKQSVGLSLPPTDLVPPKKHSHSYAVAYDYEETHGDNTSQVFFGVHKDTGALARVDFDEEVHLLISGSPNSGKTTLLKNLAFSVLRLHPCYEASIIAIADSREYLFANGFAKAVARTLQEAVAVLRAVRESVIDRIEIQEMYAVYSPELPPEEALFDEDFNQGRHVLFISHLLELLTPVAVPRETPLSEFKKLRDQIIQENAWRAEMNELLKYIIVHGEKAKVSVVCESDLFNEDSEFPAIPALLRKSARILLGDRVHLARRTLLHHPDKTSLLTYPILAGVGILSSKKWGDKEFLGWFDDHFEADLNRAEILTQSVDFGDIRPLYALAEYMD